MFLNNLLKLFNLMQSGSIDSIETMVVLALSTYQHKADMLTLKFKLPPLPTSMDALFSYLLKVPASSLDLKSSIYALHFRPVNCMNKNAV